MKIAFDLDDTLAQTCEAVLEAINKQLGTAVTAEEMTSPFWEEVIPAVTFDMVKGIFTDGVFGRLKAKEGAVSFVTALAEEGHELFVITDRFWNADDLEVTNKWLQVNGFPSMQVILCKSGDKAAKASELGISVFFEDRSKNANMISEVCISYLINMPNNINDKVVDGVIRFDGWNDFSL